MDNQELIDDIRELSTNIKRTLSKYLDSIGLKYTQWCLLKTIKNNNRPLTSVEIVDLLNSDKATISDIVKRLEIKGYITKEKNKKDNRQVFINISDTAKHLCVKVKNAEENVINDLFKNIEKKEILVFKKVIDKIEKNINDKK